jgi:transcriptional regulator
MAFIPPAFRHDDPDDLAAMIHAYPFGLLIVNGDPLPQVAHVPFVLDRWRGDRGHLRCHVARANPVWKAVGGGMPVLVVFTGPNTYVSPDWYETEGGVPTWNYAAIYVEAVARPQDDGALASTVEDLSADREGTLAPKRPWTVDKMEPGSYAVMRRAIVGLDLEITSMEGKWKMSQNRKQVDAAGALAGLAERGTHDALAVHAEMTRLGVGK